MIDIKCDVGKERGERERREREIPHFWGLSSIIRFLLQYKTQKETPSAQVYAQSIDRINHDSRKETWQTLAYTY